MSPRPYRLGQRQVASEPTRGRIVEAARELLASPDGLDEFTVEAVARKAKVARMTVYYQFGSRAGLLEAIFDDLAARGGMWDLPDTFKQPDALAALSEFVAVFVRFWASQRLIIRRLQVLTALDPELQKVSRDEWRRQGLQVILGRTAEQVGRPAPESMAGAVDVLQMLTSFQVFDQLASTRSPEEVTRLLQELGRAAVGLG
ncbi:helix-turn-helix domain-containing protein [Candidatus Nephthysia bennettiae]|uniref:TetR/AcrR family transcriptional regulator n=1 Tax=Candidatus Nephthysia bennettiae TaxID=3127016 RepID=A0A934K3C9_9BACT|nr:TetR/AcrR family transcriptional regulator [Candidatus Dormibacteraeota bacterium]MBJ7611901.1 TetR/AcrR family transcriptional regulator [Candidatus Dormibacteraeota bacterium]